MKNSETALPRVVCFGDSLTAGFQSPSPENPGGEDTPYGRYLQEWLGPSVEVCISGICGELTGEMAMRFRRDVLGLRPAYVVILGGTNDLAWNADPGQIMRNLIKMYESARGEGIVPVPVTVPSILVNVDQGGPDAETDLERHLTLREALNASIGEYARSKELPCIDLFSATADSATGQLAWRFSNDGVHLTTAGYRLFAKLLVDQVFAAAFPGRSGEPI